MTNKEKLRFSYLPGVITAIGVMTLGALGAAAVKEHIYWIPFVANILVYGGMLWKNIKDFKAYRTPDKESK